MGRLFTLAALAMGVAVTGCKTELNPLGNYLDCTDDGRCLDGYRCAHTELGAICLDDEQWQARCSGSETCDGRDEDCDGETDEEVADLITGTDEGECAVRVERCESGMWVAVEEGVEPSDETCDGLDNDCDGTADDGVPPQLSGFAIGECERSVAECIEGELVVVDVGIEPIDEVCDGLDNDCDGETDEDFLGSDDPDEEVLVLGEPCVVGAGTCATDGIGVCDPIGLGVVCDAVAGSPSTELCDGDDNDCDDETDETFAELDEPCSVGVGACVAFGVRTCRPDGFGTRCGADVLAPSDEVCDGDDNDCDGDIDEDLGDGCCIPGTTRSCGTDLGACAVGTQTCSPERFWGACSGQGPVAETCDGGDDDCDGETDEGIVDCCETPGATMACSETRGACVAGEQTCGADGAWTFCSGILPTLERCDGDDNDCDDETDEDFPDLAESCSVGSGACAASGEKVCTVDGLGTTCGVTVGTPSDETCNDLDDDCNGEADDGLVVVTGTDIGECVEGIERCIGGAWTVVQVRVDPIAELCDGLDQDCDGIADDEAPSCCTPGTVRTCGIETGECTVGSQSCTGDFSWTACTGMPPSEEHCDGLDNDCDSGVDERWTLLLGSVCSVGLGTCARSGVYECNPDFSPEEGEAAGVRCTAVPGDPGTESCNGFDDDCDGQIDEATDVPPLLEGSDVGRCEPRVVACVGGAMVEVYAGVGPTPETCNGLDDNCSGIADDGIPAFECYEGLGATEGVGICTGGLTICTDTVLRCAGQVLPNDELCDGLDNDCDGVTDGSIDAFTGDPVPLENSCYTGPSGTADIGECRSGTTTCTSGLWGGCADEALPVVEVCGDTADSDCDSRPDGITFLEDFEDNCAMPEATVTTDVPLDCVETPVDTADPSRTPTGERSLRMELEYVDRVLVTALEWRFAACSSDERGGARLFIQEPLIGGANVGFLAHPNYSDDRARLMASSGETIVEVDRVDGGFDREELEFVLSPLVWYAIEWSFTDGGRMEYFVNGVSVYIGTLTTDVDGIYLRAVVSGGGARAAMLVDDVTFSSP